MSLERVIENRQLEIVSEAMSDRMDLIKSIKVEDTLVMYLNLSVNERAKVEELRQLSPEYFLGVLGVNSPIPKNSQYKLKDKGYSKKILDIFHTIADQNGIERVVEGYVKYSPVSNRGSVTLSAWFSDFNYLTGERVKNKGSGSKYFHKHSRLKYVSKIKLDFNQWILTQVSDGIGKRLLDTAYFKEK